MDGIVKIVLALKLKFLLIILSIGSSYLIEHSVKNKVETVSSIEAIRQDTALKCSGHPEIRLLSRTVKDNHQTCPATIDHNQAKHVKYFADKPFKSKGLEIYIVL
jgi:hypothetical protein